MYSTGLAVYGQHRYLNIDNPKFHRITSKLVEGQDRENDVQVADNAAPSFPPYGLSPKYSKMHKFKTRSS